MKNIEFRSRITSPYGTQLSSVVLCIQKSDYMARITSLYGVPDLIYGFHANKTVFISTKIT